jgi:hypothetical protein
MKTERIIKWLKLYIFQLLISVGFVMVIYFSMLQFCLLCFFTALSKYTLILVNLTNLQEMPKEYSWFSFLLEAESTPWP